jgi:uncharacterized protein (TIGR02001 family)
MTFINKRIAGLAASMLAVAVLATPAFAEGMMRRGSIKDAAPAPEQRRCTLSANVALTSQYVFRGISQTAEGMAVQGGFDVACGPFYAGVWASNLDFGGDALYGGSGNDDVANIEVDLYAGLKGTHGRISWDVGVIFYTYPDSIGVAELNFFEVKAAVSGEVWTGGTLGVTVFYSPEYTGDTGETWTVETSFSQALPKVGLFSPTFSALLGWQKNEGTANFINAIGNGDDEYLYWNAGLTLGFHEKWSLDLRYWDTDISNAGSFCTGAILQCDERFVATLKFTY